MRVKNLKSEAFSTSTVSADLYKSNIKGLSQICESLTADADKKVDLRKVVHTLAVVLDGDSTDIHLRTIAGDYLISCASYGDHFGHVARGESLVSARTGRMADLLESGQPLIMDFRNPNKRDRKSKAAIDLGYMSAVATPITVGDTIIGTFSVSRKRPWNPSSLEIDYLLVIGRVLGVGMQSMTLALHADLNLPANLTDSEKKLLTLLAQGLSNEEIGAELFISEPTVKRQLRSLFQKLGLETRAQAAVFAAHAGLA
jgi:DNA-binding CsgD family transcriptional regulator